MRCDIEEKETKIKELLSDHKLASKMVEEEKQRVNNILYDERRVLETRKEKMDKLEDDLSYREKRVVEEEKENDKMFKKLWNTWLFWIIVAIISALISIFFVHGYLASDNRALNTYNKALSSYNTSIEKLNDQIMDKQTKLANKEDIWETYDCDNNDYGESMCPETKIESLKSQIDDLEKQKKELVKPQEPKEKNE